MTGWNSFLAAVTQEDRTDHLREVFFFSLALNSMQLDHSDFRAGGHGAFSSLF